MKLTAMCGVVVDVFAGAVRLESDNHRSLLVAVREIAETQKQSAATGILNGLALPSWVLTLRALLLISVWHVR